MGFLDSYKRLEKLCGDVMGNPRRVSAYIGEMEGIPLGSRYVAGWSDDLLSCGSPVAKWAAAGYNGANTEGERNLC